MKHYLLFYECADDYLARRQSFRAEHLAKAWKASERGELALGGALADPVDGAVLLFKAESRSVVEDFARADPYVINGLVRRWQVREWTTVVGNQAAMPVYPDTADNTSSSGSAGGDSDEVLRLWRGRATAAKAAEYVRHVAETVAPHLDSIPGYRGAYLLRRSTGDNVEFLVLTRWASMDAVRGFAGPDPEKAVVEPAARAALSDFEKVVAHYRIVLRMGQG